MPKLEEVIQLKEDEEVRAITRRHGITIVPPLALALLLIVAPFFFLFPLFSTGPAGVMVFAVGIVVGGIIALRTLVMWDGDIIIVTNRRIVDVDQKGVFARTVNEIAFENIQDFSWSKSNILDQILNIGNFKARSASGSLTIEARYIPRPQDLQNLLNDMRMEATDRGVRSAPRMEAATSPQRAALLKEVASRVGELDDRKLHALARDLKEEDRDIAITKLFGDGVERKADQLKPLDDEPEMAHDADDAVDETKEENG